MGNAPHLSKSINKELGTSVMSRHNSSLRFLFASCPPTCCIPSRISSRILSSMTSAYSDQTNGMDEASVAKSSGNEMEFNRVNCLVWVLHESSRSFSLAVESLGLVGTSAELAMAWNGKDVHQWHKRFAYQVAVYALLKMAIEVEMLLSHERQNNPSPVKEILSPKIDLLEKNIESQLKMRHSELIQWFRVVELPRIAGFFIPLLKKWSMEYAGSGVAGIIVAISCCAAVGKLSPCRISCPPLTLTIEDALVELMDLSHSLVAVDKLHQLATEAGFEFDFLFHFGKKILPSSTNEELEFWIGLAQRKLSLAFHKESMLSGTGSLNEKVQADSLATLGLFAYLGRRTRLFLSGMGMKDFDELVKDFLGYLECGTLFIYPEFSSISVYQLFMEIVIDEIGWLDFYAAFPCVCSQERRRCKQHAIQAETEIGLSKVFTVCYDVFSGYAHFSRSTQQPLDAELLSFLLRSQSLLTICLEDYWAAYDRSGELPRIAEAGVSDPISAPGTRGTAKLPAPFEAQKPTDLVTHGCLNIRYQQGCKLKKEQAGRSAEMSGDKSADGAHVPRSNAFHESLVRKCSIRLVSASSDVWMGTQLLVIDIMVALELLTKQIRGHSVTKREIKKLKRTMNDIATLIPITILMLLPVSAVGHAAMLAAIKKYMPSLIPSPYTSERLDEVKQLERTKKMEVRLWSNLDDQTSKIS